MDTSGGQNQRNFEGTALVLESVSRVIDSTIILKDISLALSAGESVLLLGANGAGKSTLLRICAGLMRPTSGKIAGVAGSDTGYAGHLPMLYGELSLRENLKFFATLCNQPETVVNEGLERWELAQHAHKRPAELSKGLLSRASLCRAFFHRPRCIILDEPSSALDQRSCEILVQEIGELRSYHQERLVTLVATHDLARLQGIANRIVVLNAGALIHDSGTSPQSSVDQAVKIYLQNNR